MYVSMECPAAQARTIVHGVDVTASLYFSDRKLIAASDFAAEAHKHQMRKTGEPYIQHCIESAIIVEACLPPANDDEEHDRWVGRRPGRAAARSATQ